MNKSWYLSCSFWAFFLALCLSHGTGSAVDECDDEDRMVHPILCDMIDRVNDEPDILVQELELFSRELGMSVKTVANQIDLEEEIENERRLRGAENAGVPVVLTHGVADSCFNSGMQSLTKFASKILSGAYGTCIPTGSNQREDTINGYFKNMDDSVEIFAAKVRADPKLANGFYGIGISQGNNVIRGYISKHNNPPVKKFIAINGVNAGTSAVPHCIPKGKRSQMSATSQNICDLLMEQASKRAYTQFAQKHSFQANYWRDPRPAERKAYQTYSQLAQWNNEGFHINETLKENWGKTDKFVWVMAESDEIIWPKEGEQWGAPDPNDPFNRILPMNETEWYIKDLFGLKTAQEEGKNAFESFAGRHVQFTDDDFKRWIETYLIDKEEEEKL